MLEMKKLTKTFGGLTAVDSVDFIVKEGSISGLIGPNGAGKTTIFNLITGIYKTTEGEIILDGMPIHNLKSHEIANMGVTRTFQNIRLFKRLSVYDNILTACHNNASYSIADSVLRLKRFKTQEQNLREQTHNLMEIMGLTEWSRNIAHSLPYGLQRRLEIARALAVKPKYLLLDEPAAGMNPDETLQLMMLIREIRDLFKCTVLVIEHHMDLVMGICENIMVLNFGKKLVEGPPDEIQKDPRVIKAYLGEGAKMGA